MTIPDVVNVIISLIFVYLALSLLISTVQEQLAALWEWRAKHLKTSVYQMLGNNREAKAIVDSLWRHPLIHSLNQESTTALKKLWQGQKTGAVGPSYLDAATFTTVLLEDLGDRYSLPVQNYNTPLAHLLPHLLPIADPGAPLVTPRLPESLRTTLIAIARQTQLQFTAQNPADEPTIKTFAEAIAQWYEQAMMRSSGVYKRNAAGVALILSAIVVLVGNVDSLSLIDRLYSDPTLNRAFVQIAEQSCGLVSKPSECFQSLDLSLIKDLPLGWTFSKGVIPHLLPQQNRLGVTILGWVLSAIAISRGAPFWFELLGKLINVRSTGAKPEKLET
jgi:hypothetical protein